MYIDELNNVLAMPKGDIRENSAIEWLEVEASIGVSLPEDYKSFINFYGTGCIDEFLWILNPFTKNENLNLFHHIEETGYAYLMTRDILKYNYEYFFFKKNSGLLPFGITNNGDVLYWLITEDLKVSKIVIFDDRHTLCEEYDMCTVQLLVDLLTRKISSHVFPTNFPFDKHEYRLYIEK